MERATATTFLPRSIVVPLGSAPAFSHSSSMTFSTRPGSIRTESDVMLSIGVPIRTAFFANEMRSVLRVRMVISCRDQALPIDAAPRATERSEISLQLLL